MTVATAKTRDRLDRSLPVWQGCQQLTDDQIFFLNPDTEASLDGRYFAATARHHRRSRSANLDAGGLTR